MIITDSISVLKNVLTIARESKVAIHNSKTSMWEIDEWGEWFDSVINWNQIDGVKVAFENDLVDYPIEKAKQIIACKEHADLFIQDKWSNWVIAHAGDREIIFCKVKGYKKHVIHRQWDEDPGIVWTSYYVIAPEDSSIQTVLSEYSPIHERVTVMKEDYDDE